MGQKINLRELREKAGKTLEQVSAETGIPYSTIRALEIGTGNNFSILIKQKLADYYCIPLRYISPELTKYLTLQRNHRLLTLFDFCVDDLKFQDEKAVEAVLRKMTTEELGNLFYSGLTRAEAMERLEKAAMKYKLTPPVLRK